ncbi:MAG: HD domain-containing protein [Planctomycetota bacterium]|nr:MAG: HD domain-containing protein [Planctomycetota bacterium]
MKHIRNQIEEAGGRVFRFGGAVRDAALDREPRNIDFLVADLDAEKLEEILGSHGTVRDTGLDVPAFAFRRKGAAEEQATFTPARGASIEEDLGRSDFTINAMAVDLKTGERIDPFDGASDLHGRWLRAVTDTVFEDSPIRLIRTSQIAVRLKFQVDRGTADLMYSSAKLARNLEPDEIWPEIVKLLTLGERPSFGFNIWRATGVLGILLKPLADCDVSLGKKRIPNVLDHMLVALDSTPSTKLRVRLAALLHDLGKPGTYQEAEDEEESFIGHPGLGAKLAGKLLKRLGAPKDLAKDVKHLIRNHMFNDAFDLSDSAVRRLLDRVGPDMIGDLFDMRFGDRIASGKPRLAMGKLGSLRTRIERMLAGEPDKPSVKDLAVNGKDLMEALDIEPGPEVGRILRELFERVLFDPDLNKKSKLLKLAREINKS